MTSNNLFKNKVTWQIYKSYIYVKRQDLALNYPQVLIYHETPINQPISQLLIYKVHLTL